MLYAVDNDRNSRTISDHGLIKPFELKYKPDLAMNAERMIKKLGVCFVEWEK